MFPRKKRNRTGTISVVVVDKSRGGFKEVKSFGVAKTEEEADRLYAKASEWVRRFGGQQEIDFAQSSIIQQEFLESERVLNNIWRTTSTSSVRESRRSLLTSWNGCWHRRKYQARTMNTTERTARD
jgi:hypothetical protein